MEREPVELVARWSVSVGILYLISTGDITGTWGVAATAWILTFDVQKFIKAYKSANYE